ncbi:hypothetical protein Scep_011957 [Stephania cephalantha]|uniref:Uncharacterized protein n=1 Tax=Stephania cephalantha TaxID=152367 RepID=A0AAP0P709_9MAGN
MGLPPLISRSDLPLRSGRERGGGGWPEGRPLHAKEREKREDGRWRRWMVTTALSMDVDHSGGGGRDSGGCGRDSGGGLKKWL